MYSNPNNNLRKLLLSILLSAFVAIAGSKLYQPAFNSLTTHSHAHHLISKMTMLPTYLQQKMYDLTRLPKQNPEEKSLLTGSSLLPALPSSQSRDTKSLYTSYRNHQNKHTYLIDEDNKLIQQHSPVSQQPQSSRNRNLVVAQKTEKSQQTTNQGSVKKAESQSKVETKSSQKSIKNHQSAVKPITNRSNQKNTPAVTSYRVGSKSTSPVSTPKRSSSTVSRSSSSSRSSSRK